MAILVADSGGTHTFWLLVYADGSRKELETIGLNPNLVDDNRLRTVLRAQVKPWLSDSRLTRIFFFGAGLGYPEQRIFMRDCLEGYLEQRCPISVDTDMLGAAYACLGSQSGVVGILGTGSAAFYYDGKAVAARRGGFGYLLGDEAGGFALGRALMRRLFNGNLSKVLEDHFRDFSGFTRSEALDHYQQHRNPLMFLSDQAPFLDRFRDHSEVAEILETQFCFFIRNDLLPLVKGEQDLVTFTGGVARHFPRLLTIYCERYGLENVRVLPSRPIQAIADHLQTITDFHDMD